MLTEALMFGGAEAGVALFDELFLEQPIAAKADTTMILDTDPNRRFVNGFTRLTPFVETASHFAV